MLYYNAVTSLPVLVAIVAATGEGGMVVARWVFFLQKGEQVGAMYFSWGPLNHLASMHGVPIRNHGGKSRVAPCIDACSYLESTSEHGVAWFWFTIGSCSIMVGWGMWGGCGSGRDPTGESRHSHRFSPLRIIYLYACNSPACLQLLVAVLGGSDRRQREDLVAAPPLFVHATLSACLQQNSMYAAAWKTLPVS